MGITYPGSYPGIFDNYGLYAIDNNDATYIYIGFQDNQDNYIFIRITMSTGLTLYAKGILCSTAWTNRASASYGTYAATFP